MNSEHYNTTPLPHAQLSEKYALSCLLTRPEIYFPKSGPDGIDIDAFHLPEHRTMFQHMKADYQESGSLNPGVFLQRRLLDDTLSRMGGIAVVSNIHRYASDGGDRWSDHAAILREQKARRLALMASYKISEAQDSDEAILETQNALLAISAAVSGPRRASTGKQVTDEFSGKLTADHAAGDYPGKQSGILALDEISGGMRPGEFWVVGGKPSGGKSMMLLQIAATFIERSDPVAVFSLEMMKHEVVGRLVSRMGQVDYGGITQPKKLSESDLLQIKSTTERIAAAPLWIDASAAQSIESITAEARRIRDSHGSLSLVVVDYLQLIRGGRSRNEMREEEVARVSGGLKQLAKALNCPVLSASQLNEQGQTRESRAIAQDADAVLIIADDGIRIAKMRNGVRDSVLNLKLDGRFQRFTEIQP